MHRLFAVSPFVLLTVALLIIGAGHDGASAQTAERFVTVGTGGVTGVYYPAGGAICRLVNRGRKEHGIRCSVESTAGSINNLEGLRDSELDMAIVQSDWQYYAYTGTGDFTEQGPNPKLRSVFSLHSEPLTVLVRKDSAIKTFDDIKGKRINIGNKGSGMRAMFEAITHEKGWQLSDFSVVTDIKLSDQSKSLCDGTIDAMIYSAGNPNGAIQEVTSMCPTRILNVEGPEVDALMKKSVYYAYATIPGAMYAGNPQDIKTFGAKATLMTTSDLSEEVVYQIVKAVFENLDGFKTLHPVFATVDRQRMVTDGNTAPLHPGAIRYYKEAGLYAQSPAVAPDVSFGAMPQEGVPAGNSK